MSFLENGLPVVQVQDHFETGVRVITINREKSFNAINDWTYLSLINQLQKAGKDDNVKMVVLTGKGDKAFFAGADLSKDFDPMIGELKSKKGSYHDAVGRYITELIKFPKLIVAAVNGDAI
jgi:enoyl-CoA hydratase